MKTTLFDAHNRQSITVEIDGPSYAQKIIGPGYFIIVNPGSKHVSFSKSCHDICFGDVTAEIIHEYTNQQYATEYGDKLLGLGTGQDCKRVYAAELSYEYCLKQDEYRIYFKGDFF